MITLFHWQRSVHYFLGICFAFGCGEKGGGPKNNQVPIEESTVSDPDNDYEIDKNKSNFIASIKSEPSLSMFHKAIESVGLVGLVQDRASTIFAPNDQAFNKLSSQEMDLLFNDSKMLKELIQYHICDCAVNSRDLITWAPFDSINGYRLGGTYREGETYINDILVLDTIETSSVYIFTLDKVLVSEDFFKEASRDRMQ